MRNFTPFNSASPTRCKLAFLSLGILLAWPIESGFAQDHRHRLLFDDYYQLDRGDTEFSMGVALDGTKRGLTNHYSPAVNALPNGTFAFTQAISDHFRVDITSEPISEALLASTGAYMMVSPVRKESGGRANLTAREADLLERFVARGGMLVLVMNSFAPPPAKTSLDWNGINLIVKRFGLEFLQTTTGTLSVPISPDEPGFDQVDSFIYGNGTTLRIDPTAETPKLVVRDPRDGDHAPVGVVVPYKQGRVLAFGDGGTFGNAHILRGDLHHTRAVRQLMEALLPDGPAPAYGWGEGVCLRVRLTHEQSVSGYPYRNRLLGLPVAQGSKAIVSEPRDLDLAGFADKQERKEKARYTTSINRQTATFELATAASDGRSYPATWKGEDGKDTLLFRLRPNGRSVAMSTPSPDVAPWAWALSGEAILAVLKPSVQPGDTWREDALVPLPHVQLNPSPTLRSVVSEMRFEGEVMLAGKPCYLFTRTVEMDANDARPQDFVLPESAARFRAGEVEVFSFGEMLTTKYWISRDKRLPVRTEMRGSGAIWWYDRDFPRRYEGKHDWRNFENWTNVNFVATFGRLLIAEFESR